MLKSQARKKRNKIVRSASEKAEAAALGISVEQLKTKKCNEALLMIEERKRQELALKKKEDEWRNRNSRSSYLGW